MNYRSIKGRIRSSAEWRNYFLFIQERQNIWRKKEVLRELPPWTEDPIFQQGFFTNIYRELDRCTRYELERIVFPFQDSLEEQIRRIILFRHSNSPWTYEVLSKENPTLKDLEDLKVRIESLDPTLDLYEIGRAHV